MSNSHFFLIYMPYISPAFSNKRVCFMFGVLFFVRLFSCFCRVKGILCCWITCDPHRVQRVRLKRLHKCAHHLNIMISMLKCARIRQTYTCVMINTDWLTALVSNIYRDHEKSQCRSACLLKQRKAADCLISMNQYCFHLFIITGISILGDCSNQNIFPFNRASLAPGLSI